MNAPKHVFFLKIKFVSSWNSIKEFEYGKDEELGKS